MKLKGECCEKCGDVAISDEPICSGCVVLFGMTLGQAYHVLVDMDEGYLVDMAWETISRATGPERIEAVRAYVQP